MEDPYVKSATRGLMLSHILLGFAGGAAVVLFAVLAYTQSYALVVIVPFVALAIFTAGMLYLLRQDAKAREKSGTEGE